MSLYKYQARDNKGRLITGQVEAISEARAAEVLETHGLMPTHFEVASAGASFFRNLLQQLSFVSSKDMVIFFQQLSTLVNAQVRIVISLKILTRQINSQKFRSLVEDIATEVEGGKSLSDAMAMHPRVFPELYTSLIRAGEASGSLDRSLLYLADQIAKDHDLKSKVRGAMMYPAFIVVTLVVVGSLMMIYVLPGMTAVLQESGVDLPFTTKLIIATSNFFVHYWYVLVLAIVGVIVGLRAFYRTVAGHYFFHTLFLKIPGFGPFLKKIYLYRFAHHLSNLLAGGISIVKAMQLIADIIGNWVYRDIFMEVANEVQTGRSIREVLENYKEIPPMVYQMVDVGEQTGNLHGILAKLAEFYDKEVNNGIASISSLIEPVIMVILGLAVGIMVAGILLPTYNLASSF